MLTQFKSEFHFNRLHVSVWVEPQKHEASVTVTYAGRIVTVDERIADYQRFASPEMVEAYFREEVGEYGSRLETMESTCKRNRFEIA
jgi:hypothetical protein